MQRNEPRLTELGAPDHEYLLVEVDIIAVEADDLADAHAGDGEQREHTRVRPGAQSRLRRESLRRVDEELELPVGVEVRRLAMVAVR
jgi:hypothetical protein